MMDLFVRDYEQDGGIEMRKYNFYFGWDFFFGGGWLLVQVMFLFNP